jgi:hypothetical protein
MSRRYRGKRFLGSDHARPGTPTQRNANRAEQCDAALETIRPGSLPTCGDNNAVEVGESDGAAGASERERFVGFSDPWSRAGDDRAREPDSSPSPDPRG